MTRMRTSSNFLGWLNCQVAGWFCGSLGWRSRATAARATQRLRLGAARGRALGSCSLGSPLAEALLP